MQIRTYTPADLGQITELFYNTVHSVNAKDYTAEQLDAWATGEVDLEKWNRSFQEHCTFVAIEEDVIVGFGDIDETGYLDRLYVHKDYQSQGIAASICDRLEKAFDVKKVTTHASITAKPFFIKRGYTVIKEQQVVRNGVTLTNFVMKKTMKFENRINILHLIEGAKKAEGLTVIIDVFRAFSLECYLHDMGVKEIRPIGTIEEAFRLHNIIPDSLLVGERDGKKCEGFDFGNSPSSVSTEKVAGKTILHTTSAGTQGIVNAKGADEIITGSLVNAKAIASYIMKKQPSVVSLVCMGNGGVRPAAEDELCAEYIKSILEGNEMPDIEQRTVALQQAGGEHFFNPDTQEIFPEPDFWLCIRYNRFPFVIRIEKDELGFVAKKVLV